MEEESSNKPEHFSSQEEYAELVKELRRKTFQKFLESDSDACIQYKKIIEDNDEKENRWTSYTFWSLGTAVIILLIQWIRQGFFAGLISALIVTVPFWIVTIVLSFYRDMKINERLPEHLKTLIEEDEKESFEKTGKIRIQDYADIL